MGAVKSLFSFRGNRPADEPQAARDGEAAEAQVDAAQEEQGGEASGVGSSQVGRKRKASPEGHPAKVPRKKMAQSKSRAIYESLFLRGENSDIKIHAFEEEWCLHRVYLCRSRYFASMFSGAWLETNMDTIEMQMPDKNIDCESFHQTLGYLYSNSIAIPPYRVIAILATASMLQLDELMQQCEEIMKVSVNIETVCSFYYNAENYGLVDIRYVCQQWLLDNLMIRQNSELLRGVRLDLMKELIASSDLLVIGVEIDVYTTLKKWMLLHLEPTWSGSQGALLAAADLYFDEYKTNSNGTPFLETDQGRAFGPVFQQLRLPYIICDLPSARIIEHDALIPATWLTPLYKEQWLTLIRAEQTRELGPAEVYMSEIHGNSMRCGGQLHADEPCNWTWSGFNFGWDLVVCYTNRRVVFRRSALNKSCGLSVSLLWQRRVVFRLRVISLDGTGKAVLRKDTGYHVLCLRRHQELEVVNLEDQELTFPMYVACNFLYIPEESGPSQRGESSRSPRK
ncbi:germ cell-less protein-like 1 [Arvicola amphibius]|uniref:germ cell-less protein-like 1 n=1 Tax=Arvicola amphibius TaxID=1047088 RepID=UPI0018E371B6|nr:germ cell-less protein-like 1 [Arvicola amphibius]